MNFSKREFLAENRSATENMKTETEKPRTEG